MLMLGRRSADAKIRALELRRDTSRSWAHIDMDAFFCSVEELDDPALVILSFVAQHAFCLKLDRCRSLFLSVYTHMHPE